MAGADNCGNGIVEDLVAIHKVVLGLPSDRPRENN